MPCQLPLAKARPLLLDAVTKELWNGTHHNAAIERLQKENGLDAVRIPVVWIDQDLHALRMDKCDYDEINDDHVRYLECIGDEDAAEVMRQEIENQWTNLQDV